jgi:hypothetical protein
VEGASILRDGAPYLPYGITIFGLSLPNWSSNVERDIQQIDATASFWHGNTVRIQVAPPLMLAGDQEFTTALNQEISAARALNLNVILSAQYQHFGYLPAPDSGTETFWHTIASMYAADPAVWFDLFNEPHLTNWNVWRNGGDGVVGMQNLVDTIRAVAPDNLVLAEGINQGETLQGVGAYLLDGTNIVYSVHPYFEPGRNTPTSWDANWGDLASTVPVLVGEWGEYTALKPECNTDAPILVPTFLDYLRQHRIGLIAWALLPGVLIRGSSLDTPTSYDPGVPYACTADFDTGPDAQGAGADVLQLFSGPA